MIEAFNPRLWKVHFQVDKHDDDWNYLGTEEAHGNLVVTTGLDSLAGAIMAQNGGLTATRTRIGVGDNSAAAALSDTNLSTGANRYFRVMEATYPQRTGSTLTFRSIFGTGDANFAWNCWGLDMGTATVVSNSTVNTLINRKVQSFGTKSSGNWTVTATITLA